VLKKWHCTKEFDKNHFTLHTKGNYNFALMSSNKSIQRLPVEVDPFRLVDQGRIYEGRVPVSDYPRLKEILFSNDDGLKGEPLIDIKLEFTKTDTGLAVILGKISVNLKMPCQRCLKAQVVPLETNLRVVLVASDEQAERLQDGYDTWLVEDHCLFIRDFIEDEILLALPYSVSHEICDSVIELDESILVSDLDDEQNEDVQEKANPFSVLRNLKLN